MKWGTIPCGVGCCTHLPSAWQLLPACAWHVRSHRVPAATAAAGPAPTPSASAPTNAGQPTARKPKRRKQPSPPPSSPFQLITDRHQQPVNDVPAWEPGQEPSDASVLAAVQQCSSWQELADLHAALTHHSRRTAPPAEQPAAGVQQQQEAAGHAASLQPQVVAPQHAVLLLSRLAQLCPSPRVLASPAMHAAVSMHGRLPAIAHGSAAEPQAAASVHGQPAMMQAPGTGMPPSMQAQTSSHAPMPWLPSTSGGNEDPALVLWGVGWPQPGMTATPPQRKHTRTASPTDSSSSNSSGSSGGSSRRSNSSSSRGGAVEGEAEEEGRAQQRAGVQELAGALVQAAVHHGLQQLHPVDLAELLSALAKLAYADRPLVAQVTDHLAVSGGLVALRAAPNTLTHTAWAVAKLGHDPGPQWISHYLHATSGLLPAFSAVSCTSCMWALARWGFRPADVWLQMLYIRLKEVSPQLGPQGVVNISWALAMLKVQPPREVAELLMIEAQVVFPSMTATGLATLCWALATMKQRPPGFWVEEALRLSIKLMPSVPKSACGVPFANLVWALCMWETVQPTPAWLSAFCKHSGKSVPSMSSRTLAVVLQGLADLGHTPSQEWVSFALEEFHKRGREASPASAVAVLWSVSRLLRPAKARGGPGARAWSPARKWLVRYAHILQDIADVAGMGFEQLSPNELVDVVVAMADLRYHPGTRWLAAHTARCNACVMDFTAYQIRLMRNALSVMTELHETDYLPRKGEVV